jgi:hypothetical protein
MGLDSDRGRAIPFWTDRRTGVNHQFSATLTITPDVVTVVLDIKPHSSRNRLNPTSARTMSVAILTTPTFDATTVDPFRVRFGPQGATEVHNRGHRRDVNGDGALDLVLHFTIQETGIACGDTSVSLTGETFDGRKIQGSDTITTVRCLEE